MQKKRSVGVIIGIILISVCWIWNSQTYAEPQEVTIATNKTEYRQGETITITIRNALDKSIWYFDYPRDLQFWGK